MFESLLFFVALPWWGLSVLIVAILIESVLVHNDRNGVAFFFFVAFIAFSEFFGITDLWTNVISNPVDFLIECSKYIGIGILYATYQWGLFMFKTKAKLSELRNRFITKHDAAQTNDSTFNTALDKDGIIKSEYRENYIKYLVNHEFFSHIKSLNHNVDKKVSLIPSVQDFKGDFGVWIGYWPLHLIGHLISDVIECIRDFVFSKIKNTYQGITNKIFAKFNRDM